ncbi:MAG: amidohydrolase [Victivallaceae bacterium]|nr:amidohydrolase [Victivallaceae bacterium]
MNSTLLIKNVLCNGEKTDVLIENGVFRRIVPGIDTATDRVIDGRGKIITPPFYNTHGHAAMTLLRGLSDDMALFDWLNNHIWPAEARMTPEDIYNGTRLAILEMIQSGTVFFNDMYYSPMQCIRAAEEMGVRCCIGLICLDTVPEERKVQFRVEKEKVLSQRQNFSDRIMLSLAPHAIYTVGAKSFEEIAQESSDKDLFIHVHLSETESEVAQCRKEHNGMSPVEYLHRLGVLGPKTLAAHCVWLDEKDMEILRETGTVLSHMPCSNAKLASGCFKLRETLDRGCRVTLGTDGCASNNNLSMLDEMKFATLLSKLKQMSPTGCSAREVFTMATRNGAEAFGIDAGVIEEGKKADCLLLDGNSPTLFLTSRLTSNLVYAANPECIDTVICDGRVLMENRIVPGAEEIIAKAGESARRICHGL